MEIRLKVVEKRVNDFYVPDMTVGTLGAYSVDVEVRGGVSLLNPVFILTNKPTAIQFYRYNYVYVPFWERYYFIDNVEIDGNLMYIECSIDVLATWYNTLISQTFFCIRSESDFDETIVDGLFPAHSNTKSYFAQVEQPWNWNFTDCNYVVAISNGGNNLHVGANTYYIMDYSTMYKFVNNLFETAEISIDGLVDNITKAMVDPLTYIRSVLWYPCKLDCSISHDSNISFGWWNSGTSSDYMFINDFEDSYTDLYVTWSSATLTALFWEDPKITYLHYPPYSTYTLTAYPFGIIELPQSLISVIVEGGDIQAHVRIDNITGVGTLLLCSVNDGIVSQPHLITTAQIAVEIPIGEVLQNLTGSLISGISAIQSAAHIDVAGAAQGIYNMFDCCSPQVTVQGTCGGFAQIMNTSNWNIARYYQPVDRYIDYMGGACCKDEKLGDLSGFASFENPECTGEMLREEKEIINNLLSTGIFIGEENE